LKTHGSVDLWKELQVLPILFNKTNIFDVLQRRQDILKSEISKLTSVQIGSLSEEELIRSIAANYKLETPVLEDEKAHISHREVDVDVSQDPMRMIWDRSRPFYIKGTEIIFRVPFKGDPNFFHVRPSSFDLNPPRGEVQGREIHLVQTRTDTNAAAARVEYERTLQSVKRYLGWLEGSISDFNSKIGNQVQGLVAQRRQQLTDQEGMVAALGLPVQNQGSGRSEVLGPRTHMKSPGKSLTSPKKWDVFISHATEDKVAFVRPLAETLKSSGVSVWYDEFALKIGDSLRASIDYGLANSRYGVVVASTHFFAKHWPVQELNGLWARESSGKSVILPIWHNITAEEIGKVSPMLADRFAVSSAAGIDAVVQKIIDVLDEQ
jgi:hypothetical protein